MDVMIPLEPPTRAMRTEAAAAGTYKSPWGKHPRLQVLTIAELLTGGKIEYPPAGQVNVTYKKEARVRGEMAEVVDLFGDGPGDDD